MSSNTRNTGISQDGIRIAELQTVDDATTVRLLVETFTPEDLEALAEGFHLAAVAARRSRSSREPQKEAVLAFLSPDPRKAVRLKAIQDHLGVTRQTADKIVSELAREKRVSKKVLHNMAGQPVLYWLAQNTNVAELPGVMHAQAS